MAITPHLIPTFSCTGFGFDNAFRGGCSSVRLWRIEMQAFSGLGRWRFSVARYVSPGFPKLQPRHKSKSANTSFQLLTWLYFVMVQALLAVLIHWKLAIRFDDPLDCRVPPKIRG